MKITPDNRDGHRSGSRPLWLSIASLMLFLACATTARAQGVPLPNFSGTLAGQAFRNAINQKLFGASTISPKMVPLPFASLPAEMDGQMFYCLDCLKTTPCTGGGSGAWAMGQRGIWQCGNPPLEADLLANGHNLIGALQNVTQVTPKVASPATGNQVYSGTSVTITAPTSLVLNQVEIAIINTTSAATPTPPSGWSLIPGLTIVGTHSTQYWYSHVEGVSEPSSYQWTGSGGSSWTGVIVNLSGVNTTTPVAASQVNSGAWVTSLSVNAPSGVTQGALILLAASSGGCQSLGSGLSTVAPLYNMGDFNQTNIGAYWYVLNTLGGLTANFQCPQANQDYEGAQVAINPNTVASPNYIANPFVKVINPEAAPYFAVADNQTDTAARFQAAINAAQLVNGELLAPPTTAGCYSLSQPLQITGAFHFHGAGQHATQFCPKFYGPTLNIQARPVSPIIPYISNLSAWTSGHVYPAFSDIKDPNGNTQVTKAGLTSSGSIPTFCATQGCTTSDNGGTWTLEVLGSSIATGTGSTYDVSQTSFNTKQFSLMWSPALANLNGLSNFTVEFYIVAIDINGGSSGPEIVSTNDSSFSPVPGQTMRVFFNGSNQLSCALNVGGTVTTAADTVAFTTEIPRHVACVLDNNGGSPLIRLFKSGTQVNSQAVTGTMKEDIYETMVFPANGAKWFPDAAGNQLNSARFYIDSVRFSNSARYTSNFTAPTAKFASDGQALLTINFPLPTTSQIGTIIGVAQDGYNVFMPYEVDSTGGSEIGGLQIGDMELCQGRANSMLYATWTIDSSFEHLSCVRGAYVGMELFDNDYQDVVRDASVNQPGSPSIGFAFEGASNNNEYTNLLCDGSVTCAAIETGSGEMDRVILTDRGRGAYPIILANSQATIRHMSPDMENADTNWLGCIYSETAWSPTVVLGGSCDSPGGGTGSYLVINGGKPILSYGVYYANTVARALNVINNPTYPVVIQDSPPLVSAPLTTNAGKSYWLVDRTGGQDLGMKFADLVSCTAGLNGTLRFLTDGTIGATCTGAGTGAWAKCIGTTWVCN